MEIHHRAKLFFHSLVSKKLICVLLCCLFVLPFAASASDIVLSSDSPPVLVLNSAFGPPVSNDFQTGFGDQAIAEALRRIGYQLVIIRLPAERGLINANRGIDDGELARVAGLQKKYTNLIQVPEALMNVDMVLFTKNKPDFKVNDWGSVRSYSLAIISGWKIMESNFGKFSNEIEIIKTDNVDQSFMLLAKDRVDFIAYSNWSGLGYMEANNIRDVVLLHPPLVSPKFYVYLHKKHKMIVPQLAEALSQMKRDGTVQRLYNELLLPYLKPKVQRIP